MTEDQRLAVEALILRVGHAAAIAGLLAQVEHQDSDVGAAFEGIADMLREVHLELEGLSGQPRATRS